MTARRRAALAAMALTAAILFVAARTCGGEQRGPPAGSEDGPERPSAAAETLRARSPGVAPPRSDVSSQTVRASAPERARPDGAAPPGAAEAAARRGGSPSARGALRPPADAVELPGLAGLRAWPIIRQAPAGTRGEAVRTPGVIEIAFDRRPSRTVQFRAEARPDDAFELLGDGVVAIDSRRDFAQVRVAGLRRGPATLLLTLLDETGAPTPLVLTVPIEVSSYGESDAPVVGLRAPRSDAIGPGCCAASQSSLTGLAGMRLGLLFLERTPFRDAATRPTEGSVEIDDPQHVLGDLPSSWTIPAGQTVSPPIPLDLTEHEGTARIVFSTGSQRLSLRVVSVSPVWSAPEQVAVPEGATADIVARIDLERRPVRPPEVTATADAEGAVVAGPAEEMPPLPHEVRVPVRAVRRGKGTVSLRAAGFPPLVVRVDVVPAEVVHVGGVLRILAPPNGTRGTVSVTLGRGARFASAPPAWQEPPGVTAVRGWGTGRLVVELDVRGAPDAIDVPARIEGGTPPVRLRIEDAARRPPRPAYSVESR